MIDFTTVSREFRSLVTRRRELLTFLGSVFAALGILLQNVLEGKLPEKLRMMETHIFAFYAVLLMAPSLVLALRNARLHGGMVLNGILYARLMQEQSFTRKGSPERAARHNFLGVSFLMFVLAMLMAGFSTTLLAVALDWHWGLSAALGLAVVLGLLLLYFRFHHKAARFAMDKIKNDTCGPVEVNEWQGHVGASLEDVNRDMIVIVAFVGLIMFSVLESLSGLGQIARQTDLASSDVQEYAPLVYGWMMLLTAIMGLVTYIRLRIAVGNFSLQIDPSDRPFRPLRLTDSLLGYVLVAFLFGVSIYIISSLYWPAARGTTLVFVGLVAFLLAVAAEQVSLIVANRTIRGTP